MPKEVRKKNNNKSSRREDDIDKVEKEIQKAVTNSERVNTKKAKKVAVDDMKANSNRKTSAGRDRNHFKTAGKIIGIVFGVIVLALLIYGLRVWLAYNGFLDKITGHKPETKEYSVLVLSTSNTTDVHELERKNIGYLTTDPKAGNAEQYLQTVVRHDSSFYDDLETLTGVLSNKITSAIVAESDWVQAMKDELNDDATDVRVIYTFTIQLDSEDVEISKKDVTKEPFIVYISGSDSRSGIKATARSDVNIVAVVNPAKSKILLVSIPRDTYVQLHNTTGIKDKLTHAGVYGINMSKTTIEDFLGIDIDYTIKVSFDTVVKIVDQIDGIEIESDQDMTLGSGVSGKVCKFTTGKQLVDGNCALRFARERKSYSTGDRHRGENQQQVITSIIDKLSSSRNYLLKLPSILDIAADSFETSFSRDEISTMIGIQLSNNPKWEVKSIAVDGAGTYEPTYSMGANRPLYVMIPSEQSVKEAKNKIAEYLEQE